MSVRRIMAVCAVVVVAAGGAHAREVRSLDRDWRFHLGDPEPFSMLPAGEPITQWEFLPVPRVVSGADPFTISIPAESSTGWRAVAVDEDAFQGRKTFGWFRTRLTPTRLRAPAIWFTMVDDNGTVYLNGARLGQHNGWNEPFEIKLGTGWNRDQPNSLLVLVENAGGGPGRIGPASIYDGAAKLAVPRTAAPAYADAGWRTVNVPHDFVVEQPFDPKGDTGHGSQSHGVGWYRRTFMLPATDDGRRFRLEFDGVYRDSAVFLNGTLLGRHQSGYTSFGFDVTDLVKTGQPNVLAVRADATDNEGWWYEGGGIYRHVRLIVTDPIHVEPWGIFVRNGEIENGQAPVRITVSMNVAAAAHPTVENTILGPDGHQVWTALSDAATSRVEVTARINSATLWSPEAPARYILVTTVRDGKREADRVETRFGIRTIRFDPEKGFLLNGQPIKLKGTCNHQDFAGVGVALPDALNEYKIRTLKAWGANAYRCSHHPPTPELLDACDRLGMLVMDENRHLGDTPEILGQVEAMVLRDRNHPSIVIWSTCNEEGQQGTELGGKQGKAIADVIRKFDGTRPTTSAMNQRESWGKGLTLVEDVQGTNYNPEGYDEFHKAFPSKPMVSTESHSTTTTRGVYAKDEKAGFVSNFNENTEYCWRMVAERPFVAGTFVWTGFDYRGEPTPYGWPCISSHFGFLDTLGFPKDDAFYYKAWWGSAPTVHVFPHWNPEGKVKGKPVAVRCYGNTDRVELFVNGKSSGAKVMPKYGHVDWEVPYAPGVLMVKGLSGTGEAVSETVETTGKPAAVRLVPDRTRLDADGSDVAVVRVEIVDAQGRVVPTADNEVQFSVSAGGEMIGVGNGNPSSHEPDRATKRKAFNGLCGVLVQTSTTPGPITLRASAKGLAAAAVQLEAGGPERGEAGSRGRGPGGGGGHI